MVYHFWKGVAVVAVVLSWAVVMPQHAHAQWFWQKPEAIKQDTAKKDTAAKKNPVTEKTKSCKRYDGLFTLFQDTATGAAWLLLRKDQLGKDYLYFGYNENGPIWSGHTRGGYRDAKLFKLNRVFDKIEWVTPNLNFYFDSTKAISRAKDANISPAVLFSLKIAAEDSTKEEVLIDASAIFLSETLHQVKPTNSPVLGSLNRDKSKYVFMRSYPLNTDVMVEYVFDSPAPTFWGGDDITDPRAISIKVQHSFVELPPNDYKPRLDDPRVGYFTIQKEDLSSRELINWRDYICRWKLVKKDPNAVLSEPVEPIVFWVENTTPEDIREIVRDAVLAWNFAFEKAGFRNAIQCYIQPDTATWEAADIRYNVIRWTSSPYPPYLGLGPSISDPRTGQILGADIMLEYSYMAYRYRFEENFVTAGFYTPDSAQMHNPYHCSLGHGLMHGLYFGQAATYAMLDGAAAEAEMTRFTRESIYYLVLHEVGHTLGLMHNMKSSQLYTPDLIHNRTLTEATGLLGSVMDYPCPNVSPDPSRQGQFFTTRPGPYDLWAIEYGYSTALADPIAEKNRIDAILARSTEPALTFGNDADDMRFPGFGIDPRCMIFDISGDAITYSIERMELCNSLLTRLKQKASRPNESYQRLTSAYYAITGEYANAARIISRYIGGVYVDRAFNGQPGASAKPFTPVALKEQKRAMEALSRYLFAPDAFRVPEELWGMLQNQRRGFNFFLNPEDPKIHDRYLNFQIATLNHLMHPNVLKRLNDSKMYGNEYSTSQFLTDLTDAAFAADMQTTVNTYRRNLQIEYTKRLLYAAGLMTPALTNSYYDNLTQVAAYTQVRRLQKQLEAALTSGDKETQDHRQYLLDYIRRSLEKRN